MLPNVSSKSDHVLEVFLELCIATSMLLPTSSSVGWGSRSMQFMVTSNINEADAQSMLCVLLYWGASGIFKCLYGDDPPEPVEQCTQRPTSAV